MKIAVTVESDAYQYSYDGYATDKYTAVFDSSKVTIDMMLDWAEKMIGKRPPIGRLIISEVTDGV